MRRLLASAVLGLVVPVLLWACSSPGTTVIVQQNPTPTPVQDGAARDGDAGDLLDASEEADAADAADAAGPVCTKKPSVFCGVGVVATGWNCPPGAPSPVPGACAPAPPDDSGTTPAGDTCCP